MRTPAAMKLRQSLKNSLKVCDTSTLINVLPKESLGHLLHDWQIWARDDQLPPVVKNKTWSNWLILGGRGAGKTRAGAEWVRAQALGKPPITTKPARRIALIGETLGDVRRVMVEGVSGILSIHPDNERPLYEPSKRKLTWPNGSIAELFSAEDPESLRGPQFMAAWCDELCKWPNPNKTWDMLQFAMRLGDYPQQVITTTPRPIELLRKIMKDKNTVIQRCKTDDNAANLSKHFLQTVNEKYAGTRLGRQELDGEIIEDRPDALWKRDQLEHFRVSHPTELRRIVIAIDPPVTSGENADLCGIIAAGLGENGRAFILKDQSCSRATPLQWARKAIDLYDQLEADRLIAEVNQGGDLVETVLRQIEPNIPITKVRAQRGKWLRAEPVSALYEQGKVSHVGSMPELEDQMCDFAPGGLSNGNSPDRVDALVWALTDLLLNQPQEPRLRRLD